jgi:amino acid transporter
MRGAISYLSNVVIGVASTAPAYSLAATIGFVVLISGMGVHSPAVIIVSFIPMLFIAWAYKAMNAADPDCGTSFSWITRSMGARWGFVIGWTVLFSDIVVNANQAQIAGTYGFKLFGLDAASNSTLDVTILGVGSGIILMLVRKATRPEFFRREKRLVYGDPIEVVTPEAEFAPADSLL